MKDVHRLAHFGVRFEDSSNGGIVVHHDSDSSLVLKVNSMQHLDIMLMELKNRFFYR